MSQVLPNGKTVHTLNPDYRIEKLNGVTTSESYISSNGQLVYSVIARSEASSDAAIHKYFSPDHLGSTNLASDKNGNLISFEDYYSFGKPRTSLNALGTTQETRQYIGKEYDPDLRLSYLEARYYDSNAGRFISADPAALYAPETFLGDPQQLNLYSYARNNPIVLSDPNGLCIWDGCLAEFALAALGITLILEAFNAQVANAPGPGDPTYHRSEAEIAAFTAANVITGVTGALELRALMQAGTSSGQIQRFQGSVNTQVAESGALTKTYTAPKGFVFAQKTASYGFQEGGAYAGETIGSLSSKIQSGKLDPNTIKVGYIEKNGQKILQNSRSSAALIDSGVGIGEKNLEKIVEKSEDFRRIQDQLNRNGQNGSSTLSVKIPNSNTSSNLPVYGPPDPRKK